MSNYEERKKKLREEKKRIAREEKIQEKQREKERILSHNLDLFASKKSFRVLLKSFHAWRSLLLSLKTNELKFTSICNLRKLRRSWRLWTDKFTKSRTYKEAIKEALEEERKQSDLRKAIQIYCKSTLTKYLRQWTRAFALRKEIKDKLFKENIAAIKSQKALEKNHVGNYEKVSTFEGEQVSIPPHTSNFFAKEQSKKFEEGLFFTPLTWKRRKNSENTKQNLMLKLKKGKRRGTSF